MPPSSISPARAAAHEILSRARRSNMLLDELFDRALAEHNLSDEDRRLTQEIVYGATRWRNRIDFVLNHRLKKGLESLPEPVVDILRIATYELLFLDHVPAYATVSEAVALVGSLKPYAGLKSVVNGTLRNITREPGAPPLPAFESNPIDYLAVAESHPREIVTRWIELWGADRARQMCEAGNRRPQLTARVMLHKTSREQVLEALQQPGVSAEIVEQHPAAIRFTGPVTLQSVKPFAEGLLQIQDINGMMVAPILGPQPGEIVWDVCAAPGGKTTHLADLARDRAIIIATDKSPERLAKLTDSIQRLRLTSIRTSVFDPLRTDGPPPGGEDGFDAILLDVPCTGWATFARRPDLRWRVTLDDGPRLAEQALQLLQRCWRFLRPGGRLVYSTCTLNPEENDGVIERFLQECPAATEADVDTHVPAPHRAALVQGGRLHIWPGTLSTDGGFAARFQMKR